MRSTSRNLSVPRMGARYSTKCAASAATVARRRNACPAVSNPAAGRVPGRMLTPQSPRGRRQRDASLAGAAAASVSGSLSSSVAALLDAGSEKTGASFGLLEPDILLPSQFFAMLCKQAPRKTGECQLVLAVLEDAVHCFQKYLLARNRRERRLFEEAQDWMTRRDTGAAADDRPTFSFEYVCEVLNLDPEYLRGGLNRWRKQQLVRAALSGSGTLAGAPLLATA